jgi:hypothetical protein
VSGHGDPDPHARAANQMKQASSSARGTVIQVPSPRVRGTHRETYHTHPCGPGRQVNPPSRESIQNESVPYLDTMRARL